MSGFERLADNPGGREVEPRIGVAPDYINAWAHLAGTSEMSPDNPALARIAEKIVRRALSQDIPKYEDYIRKKYDHTTADRIMQQSNPEVVAQLDTLVNEYNSQREMIAQQADWAAARALLDRAAELIQQPKKI